MEKNKEERGPGELLDHLPYLRNISTDLKQFMVVILMNADFIVHSESTSEDSFEAAKGVAEACNQMRKTVRQLDEIILKVGRSKSDGEQ